MRKFVIVTAALLAGAAAPAAGHAAEWTVAKVSQPSRYSEDNKTWHVIKPGMTISNGSWISTGNRGRVVLQRAKDRVTFQPDTLAGVFEKAGTAIHTDFAQQSGTLTLNIDPQVKPHLAVQTPFLAAVVKGTKFSVSVNDKGATVGVDRGRVEVTDALSGERAGVHAGQKASVDNKASTSMSFSGVNKDFEPVTRVAPFAPMVSQPPSLDDVNAGVDNSAKTNATSKSSASGTSADSAGDGKDSGGDSKGGNGNGNGNGGNGNGGKGHDGKGGGNSGNGPGGKGNDGNGGSKGSDGSPGKGGHEGRGSNSGKGNTSEGKNDNTGGGKPGKGPNKGGKGPNKGGKGDNKDKGSEGRHHGKDDKGGHR